MNAPCCDAHNHLQDPRFAPVLESVIAEMCEAGVPRCVVNGTCQDDWPRVADLAHRHPNIIIPSFGLHPWKASARRPDWLDALGAALDEFPASALGECGLDRWMRDYDLADQREVFLAQLALAANRNLPLAIHCLQAWGPLLECLRNHPAPGRGFLLHSYGGSAELVTEFADLGAYFSFSGHFLHPHKEKSRDAFRRVPPDRLLIESDAPDMLPPPDACAFNLTGADGEALNHPGNLPAIAAGLATVLGIGDEELREGTAKNYETFFAR